jgi:hypothetical protein
MRKAKRSFHRQFSQLKSNQNLIYSLQSYVSDEKTATRIAVDVSGGPFMEKRGFKVKGYSKLNSTKASGL